MVEIDVNVPYKEILQQLSWETCNSCALNNETFVGHRPSSFGEDEKR